MSGDATGWSFWSISEKTRRLFPTTFWELARTGMMPLVVTCPAFGQPGSASVLQAVPSDADGAASDAAGAEVVATFPAHAARSAAASSTVAERRTDACTAGGYPPRSEGALEPAEGLRGPPRGRHATIRRCPGRRAHRTAHRRAGSS